MTTLHGLPVAPRQRRDVPAFHHSVDVVVVGFGAAGTCAAYEAASAGASVLVLERTGGAGGAAALAEGIVYLGGGTPTQVAAGVTDTPEAMEAYLLAACGPAPDRAKIAAYVAGSLEHHQFRRRERLALHRGRRSCTERTPGQDRALDGLAPHEDLGRSGGCRWGRGGLRHPS